MFIKIFSFIVMYLVINMLLILLIDKLTTVDNKSSYPITIPFKLFVFLVFTSIPMLFFLNQIRKYRSDKYKNDRYEHLKFVYTCFYTSFEKKEYVNDTNYIEFKNLDRFYKLKKINRNIEKRRWWKLIG